jgi:hypothetical protein
MWIKKLSFVKKRSQQVGKPSEKLRNGILLQKLFWPTVRKNCSSDPKTLYRFKAENLQMFWDD